MKVTAVMSRPVITVLPSTSVKDAARLLIEHSISALPVVDTTGAVVGIVSEADLLPMQARPDPRAQATPIPPTAGTTPHSVADVMTKRVVTVQSTAEVSQAARIMIEADIKRVPVMRGARVVGIVSRRDLVRVIARGDREVEAELERELRHAGIGLEGTHTRVEAGVATIAAQHEDRAGRLAESVALTVPGVLEVRFAK